MPDNVQGVMVAGGFLNNAVYWFQILDDASGFRVKDLPALNHVVVEAAPEGLEQPARDACRLRSGGEVRFRCAAVVNVCVVHPFIELVPRGVRSSQTRQGSRTQRGATHACGNSDGTAVVQLPVASSEISGSKSIAGPASG